jgi:hypothetical protein
MPVHAVRTEGTWTSRSDLDKREPASTGSHRWSWAASVQGTQRTIESRKRTVVGWRVRAG